MQKLTYVNTIPSELGVYHYGFDHPGPGVSFGPAIWDCYLIHYVRRGKGTCVIDGKTYHLKKGQGFLIQPGQIGYYISDVEDEWKYCYIGFDGSKSKFYLDQAQITRENPIFKYKLKYSLSEIVRQLIAVENDIIIRETSQMSLIYNFISRLIENAQDKNMPSRYSGERTEYYIELAASYMIKNYSIKITIQDVARHVGLNASYLGSLFKAEFGVSPQEFLRNYRLDRACELMNNPMLTIGDISRSVGYEDQLQFSKIFKKTKGVSPKVFRDDIK